jgi:hypothetical protein
MMVDLKADQKVDIKVAKMAYLKAVSKVVMMAASMALQLVNKKAEM